MNAQALKERDGMTHDLSTARTMKELETLYFNWIGHDEHGCDSALDLIDMLRDYIREFCYSCGIPCPLFS